MLRAIDTPCNGGQDRATLESTNVPIANLADVEIPLPAGTIDGASVDIPVNTMLLGNTLFEIVVNGASFAPLLIGAGVTGVVPWPTGIIPIALSDRVAFRIRNLVDAPGSLIRASMTAKFLPT